MESNQAVNLIYISSDMEELKKYNRLGPEESFAYGDLVFIEEIDGKRKFAVVGNPVLVKTRGLKVGVSEVWRKA